MVTAVIEHVSRVLGWLYEDVEGRIWCWEVRRGMIGRDVWAE